MRERRKEEHSLPGGLARDSSEHMLMSLITMPLINNGIQWQPITSQRLLTSDPQEVTSYFLDYGCRDTQPQDPTAHPQGHNVPGV